MSHDEHEPRDDDALTRALAALPREEAPSVDLWPGIAARLAAPNRAELAPRAGVSAGAELTASRGVITGAEPAPRAEVITLPRARARALHLRTLAVAASLAVAALGVARLGATLETRSDEARTAPARTAVAPKTEVAFVAFGPSEDAYRAAAAELLVTLEARRGSIRPDTLAVIEANLKIIDESITRVRAALAADPASADLTFLLSSAYQTKLDLLRQVSHLPDRT